MSGSSSSDAPREADPIADSLLSESVYERLRYTEGIIILPVGRVLLYQAALLGLLATILPLYAIYPDAVAEHVGTLDPFLATPQVLFLGVVGWASEIGSALTLTGTYWYRIRTEPLSEATARTVVTVEQIAIGLSLITGGIAIVATVGLIALGAFGASVLSTYLGAVAGENVFAQGGRLSVGHLSILAMLGCVGTLGVRTAISR